MTIEVSGGIVRSYIEAFRLFPRIPSGVLAKHGIGKLSDDGGQLAYDPVAYYPIERVTAALAEIAELAGPRKMYEMGLEVLKNAVLPPNAGDLRSAMAMFDAGYHLNHRKGGRSMFDPSTGNITDGIGHYRSTMENDRILLDVDAPYDCDFDRGIITAWARRFEKKAALRHLDPERCRKRGSPRCRYEVTW